MARRISQPVDEQWTRWPHSLGGDGLSTKLVVPKRELEDFCRRHAIRRLALFGSVLREDFGPESDVDVLVEFKPGSEVGLEFFRMQEELSEILGRGVDLNTPGFISKYFREQVLSEAEEVYAEAE